MGVHRIGIDLGGTKIESVLLDPEGRELFRLRVPSPAAEGYGAVLAALADLYRATAIHVPDQSPHGLGLGMPGSLDPATGLVRNANSTCLNGRPLQRDLEALIGRPLAADNDANCFALAEAACGAGRGFGLVFGVIMGTGCGGGLVLDGQIRRGPHRLAGEWGHVSIAPHGPACWCGNRGCVETLISGSGVEAQHLARTGRRMSMDAIVAGARRGDPDCAATFDRFLDDFGRALGGLVSILDPDVVVLGGGLSHIEDLYGVGTQRMRRYAFHDALATPVLRNGLGDSAGVLGAAWIGAGAVGVGGA